MLTRYSEPPAVHDSATGDVTSAPSAGPTSGSVAIGGQGWVVPKRKTSLRTSAHPEKCATMNQRTTSPGTNFCSAFVLPSTRP
jgi:hypothetical protein